MDFLDLRGNAFDVMTSDRYSYSEREQTPVESTNRVAKRSMGTESITTSENLILKTLPREIFETLRPHLRRSHVRKEQFLYQQDDELDTVYFPETAVISELHILEDGRMVEIAITGREGVLGISALYHPSCRIANCVQITQAGSVLKIESAMLKKVCSIHPQLLSLLHSSFEGYIRQISQKAVCNMYHSVEERFCTWLLMVRNRSGSSELKLTHEQIARILGVYRPSVTCIALDMRKKKLIDYSRGRISIRNRDQMRDHACNCYTELDDLFIVPPAPAFR